jgi:cytidylate kinase
VIRGVAARDNVVILGRGSQAILRHEPGVLHVYAAADTEQRIGRLVQAEGMRRHDAEQRIKQSDAGRREFHRHYFKLEADDPSLYDLAVHTGRIPMPLAVRLVRTVLDERAPRPG